MIKASEAQVKRQQERKRNGQYRSYPPCELCDRVVGLNFCTDSRQSLGLGVHGLVLCANCARKVAAVDDASARAMFHARHPEWAECCNDL